MISNYFTTSFDVLRATCSDNLSTIMPTYARDEQDILETLFLLADILAIQLFSENILIVFYKNFKGKTSQTSI